MGAKMKYACLGYIDEKTWEAVTEGRAPDTSDKLFDYDDVIRKSGHFVGGEALKSARHATTLRLQNGKVTVTDGPFTETKEQLGGFIILEAADLNQAIQVMSQHPSFAMGTTWEIRPLVDLSVLRADFERRRSGKGASA
jgi:hypothetical protein